MSIRNNGVSLTFIGFIGVLVFLALTMNCLSMVSGAATDNKETAACTCAYQIKQVNTTTTTTNVPCDDCGTCKATFPQSTWEYTDMCSTGGPSCVMTSTNNNGTQTFNGTCTQVNNRWCCVNPSNSPPMGGQVTMCACQ